MSRINLNQIQVQDRTGAAPQNSTIIARTDGNHLWSGNSTESLLIPAGTDAQKSSFVPQLGSMRFNTTFARYEGYDGNGWFQFGEASIIQGTCAMPGFPIKIDATTGINGQTAGVLEIAAGGICVTSFSQAGLNSQVTIQADGSNPRFELLENGLSQGAIYYNNNGVNFTGDPGVTQGFHNSDASIRLQPNHEIDLLEPVNVGNEIRFNSAQANTTDLIITSNSGISLVIDNDNNEDTSVFEIFKHNMETTGFRVTQDGRIGINSGDVKNPSVTVNSAGTSGFYHDDPTMEIRAVIDCVDKFNIGPGDIESLVPLALTAGVVAAPGLTFSGNSNTGIFSSNTNNINLASNGIEILEMNDQGISPRTSIILPSSPLNSGLGISLEGSPTTGINNNSGDIDFVVGGTSVMIATNNTLTVDTSAQIQLPSGTVVTPAISIGNNPGINGFWSEANNEINTAVNSVKTQSWEETETTIHTKLIVQGDLCLGGSTSTVDNLNGVVIPIFATPGPLGGPFTYDGNLYEAVIAEYLIKVGGRVAVGQLMIATDGTDISLTDNRTSPMSTGIEFVASVSSGTVTVSYTNSDSLTGSVHFNIRRWGL